MTPDIGTGLGFGLFEPSKLLYKDLHRSLTALGSVELGSSNKDASLRLVQESPLLKLSAAYVGNFDGEAKAMRVLIDALRSRFPQAYLIAMVDSEEFRVGADYNVLYENLFVDFATIITRIQEAQARNRT